MKKQEFEDRLKELNLNKKQFAQIANMSHKAVLSWETGKLSTPIPSWVNPFLEYYKKALALEKMKDICREI